MRSGTVLVGHDVLLLANSERSSSIAAFSLSNWAHLFESFDSMEEIHGIQIFIISTSTFQSHQTHSMTSIVAKRIALLVAEFFPLNFPLLQTIHFSSLVIIRSKKIDRFRCSLAANRKWRCG